MRECRQRERDVSPVVWASPYKYSVRTLVSTQTANASSVCFEYHKQSLGKGYPPWPTPLPGLMRVRANPSVRQSRVFFSSNCWHRPHKLKWYQINYAAVFIFILLPTLCGRVNNSVCSNRRHARLLRFVKRASIFSSALHASHSTLMY